MVKMTVRYFTLEDGKYDGQTDFKTSPTVTKLQIAELSLKRKVHEFEFKTLTSGRLIDSRKVGDSGARPPEFSTIRCFTN